MSGKYFLIDYYFLYTRNVFIAEDKCSLNNIRAISIIYNTAAVG